MHLFRSINFGEQFNSALIFGSQFIGHFISDKAMATGYWGEKGAREPGSQGAREQRMCGIHLKTMALQETKGPKPASRVCSV